VAGIKGEETDTNGTVYYDGEPFGVIVDDIATLTKEQLCEAINNYDRCVVRCPDGSYNMLDPQSSEYEWGTNVEDTARET